MASCDLNTQEREQLFQAATDGDLGQIEQSLLGGSSLFRHFVALTDVLNKKTNKNRLEHAMGIENDRGYTLLHVAAQEGHLHVVDWLLQQKGSHVNAMTFSFNGRAQSRPIDDSLISNSFTKERVVSEAALHIATRCGQRYMVKWLLENGANVNLLDSTGMSALHMACIGGRTDIIHILLDNNARDDVLTTTSKLSPLHLACALGEVEAARTMLQRSRNRRRLLSQKGASGMTAIHFSMDWRSHFEASDLLSGRYGPGDVVAPSLSFRHVGIDLTHILLEYGADVNAIDDEGETALHLVCKEGYVEGTQVLLNSGAQVDLKCKHGHNALHKVCLWSESTKIVELLLERTNGAIAHSSTTKDRMTCLHQVAMKGNVRVAEVVVKKSGIQVDVRDQYGETPIHYAARHSPEMLEWLVAHFKDAAIDLFGSEDLAGVTPLHCAVRFRSPRAIQFMLEKRALFMNSRGIEYHQPDP